MDNGTDNSLNNFEKFPGQSQEASGEISQEQIEKAAEWENTMKNAPDFAGEQFGQTNEITSQNNEAITNGTIIGGVSEIVDDTEETPPDDYNASIANASSLINYGLNAAAKKLGVETVIQKIKTFDATNSSDPIGDLFKHLGVDTTAEKREIFDSSRTLKTEETESRINLSTPKQNKSVDGAFKAIEDMKKLITEVEGASSKYKELRERARSANQGYFENAVKELESQDLVSLFNVLKQQQEKEESTPPEENKSENLSEQQGNREEINQ